MNYEDENSVDFDIAINNILGVLNSRLLNLYSKLDPKVEQLGKLAKIWAKKFEISAQNNGLSSYAIILLVIYFLQINKFIPSLQAISRDSEYIEIKRKVRSNFIEKFKTRADFCLDLDYARNKAV